MSLLRTWYLNKKLNEIDKWLIPEENELKESDVDKKLELYDEAFSKASDIFLDMMSNLWVMTFVIVKYVICFFLLFSVAGQSTNHDPFTFFISAICIVFYRRHDLNELHDRFRDIELQYLLNKTRLLSAALQNARKNSKEQ